MADKKFDDNSKKLRRFLQLIVDRLAAQSAIYLAEIVYLDPFSSSHKPMLEKAKSPLSLMLEEAETPLSLWSNILAELQLQFLCWLAESPPAFSIHQYRLKKLKFAVYFCPYGYRQQQCQYLLIVAKKVLSLGEQQNIQQIAMLISEYLELYSESLQLQHQIQLLEQTIQRLGHQLRHQLSLIGLYAENLWRGLTQGFLKERAAIIGKTVQDLDRDLTELIYYSNSETLQLSQQDLRCLIVECLQGFQAWIGEKKLQVCYPDTSVILNVDRLQMKQVFNNLLSNAIHFSPIGSTIAVNWQVFHSEVTISIANEGSGLSPTDLQNLFTPFYSRRPEGTGLGLAIAQEIVVTHKGKLWANFLPTKGAEFSLSLPLSITSI